MQQENDSYLVRLWRHILQASILWLQRSGDRDMEHLLRSKTPDRLLKLIENMRYISIPDKKIHIALSSIFVQMLYGNFEGATLALGAINPIELPPRAKPFYLYLQATLAYLYYRNYEQGLQIAREARLLVGHSKPSPAQHIAFAAHEAYQSTILATYDAYIEMGEVLVGHTTTSVIKSLESKAKQLPFLFKPLILWALEIAYLQMGETQRASEISALRLKLAPYCRGLTRPDVLLKR